MTESGPYAWAYDASGIAVGDLLPHFSGEAGTVFERLLARSCPDVTCLLCWHAWAAASMLFSGCLPGAHLGMCLQECKC